MNDLRTVGLNVLALAGVMAMGMGTSAARGGVTVVDRPATATPAAGAKESLYVFNREPLEPNPLAKLPVGSITPRGWLRAQLVLEADGFPGRLTEISGFLKKEGNAWLHPDQTGHSGWEEVPYWLKGFGDLGYVLGDERIIKEARSWVEAAIASQREDGYFGPRSNLGTGKDGKPGKPDLWPNMVMLNALQTYCEFTGDKRVPELMAKYFRWEATIQEADLLPPYWQQQRGADNVASIYWLYNRTGDKSLLPLAERLHRHTAKWDDGVPDWHNVNMTQAFRGPEVFWQQSHELRHKEATEKDYQEFMGLYGQVPGGLFGGDENCRPGYGGPRQAIETCGIVEAMLSDEMLLTIDGDVKWADRCEDAAFNSLPASTTADFKALRYLTAPNQVISDARDKSPGVQNGGPMFLMNPHDHRCCQHNMAHGWPYLAEHLWLATPDRGLAFVLYAACEVKAKVGDGGEVRIAAATNYPFSDRIELTVSLAAAAKAVEFPLYLRVPGWCDGAKVSINGQAADVKARAGAYLRVERAWGDGDKVVLELPMKVSLRTWKANHDCVSVDRGPLTYSLKIGEKYVRHGGTDAWPAWEILPTTAWNYGLELDAANPAGSFAPAEAAAWPKDDQPWKPDAVPAALHAKARKIPAWQTDGKGLVGRMQQSPVTSAEPVEDVTLIPMGAARLRIAAFPTIAGQGVAGNEWAAPAEVKTEASHCNAGDTIDALTDGLAPKSSNDQTIPRFTWWAHKGTAEWVQLTFPKPRAVASAEVYWFDDTGKGECRVPKSWRLMYKDGDAWKPVAPAAAAAPAAGAEAFGCATDKFNKVTFEAVTTTALRIEVQLQDKFSGGILEWRVGGK